MASVDARTMPCAPLMILLTLLLTAFAIGNAAIESSPLFDTPLVLGNESNPRVAIPFGTLDDVRFSLVHTAESSFDIDEIASDQEWEKHKKKGFYYSCLLDMTIEAAGRNLGDTRTPPSAESLYQGDFKDELRRWGWTDVPMEFDNNCDFRDDEDVHYNNKIGTALTALGLSLLPVGRGGDNECHSVEHGDDDFENGEFYYRDGEEMPLTGAHYRFATNKRAGAIFAEDLLSPKAAVAKYFEEGVVPADDLPKLARCSDILWSYWLRNNPHPQNIKYYFANHIRNDETLPLISRVLRDHNMNLVPRWPGLRLEMSTDEAKVIIGSPIGSIIAHLLLQHKAALGVKNLGSITIFRDNHRHDNPHTVVPEVQLLFEITDVPGDKIMDDGSELPKTSDTTAKRDMGKSLVREHKVVVRLDSR